MCSSTCICLFWYISHLSITLTFFPKTFKQNSFPWPNTTYPQKCCNSTNIGRGYIFFIALFCSHFTDKKQSFVKFRHLLRVRNSGNAKLFLTHVSLELQIYNTKAHGRWGVLSPKEVRRWVLKHSAKLVVLCCSCTACLVSQTAWKQIILDKQAGLTVTGDTELSCLEHHPNAPGLQVRFPARAHIRVNQWKKYINKGSNKSMSLSPPSSHSQINK